MIWYQALVLGIVQGLTEFLPISSSGHLVILPFVFGWNNQPLVFDLILHLGTAVALITYFRNDIKKIAQSLISEINNEKKKADKYSYESKLGLFIILGSVPAALIGYFLEDFIESAFRGVGTTAILLFLGSMLMLYAEFKYSKREFHSDLTGKKSLLIGLFQTLALFPGFSRSGSTISGGMLLGLHREYAARFSFLLSIPIVLGAASFKVISASNAELAEVGLVPLILGFTASFIVGYMALDVLLKFLKTRSLYAFIVYRLLLVVFLTLFSLNLV